MRSTLGHHSALTLHRFPHLRFPHSAPLPQANPLGRHARTRASKASAWARASSAPSAATVHAAAGAKAPAASLGRERCCCVCARARACACACACACVRGWVSECVGGCVCVCVHSYENISSSIHIILLWFAQSRQARVHFAQGRPRRTPWAAPGLGALGLCHAELPGQAGSLLLGLMFFLVFLQSLKPQNKVRFEPNTPTQISAVVFSQFFRLPFRTLSVVLDSGLARAGSRGRFNLQFVAHSVATASWCSGVSG